jgi:hypothetical protein
MVSEMLLDMVEKTREICVIPTLVSCIIYTYSFELWVSCASFNTFVIVVSFINTLWEPYHVTIWIFEVHNTTSVAMANQVKSLLDSFGLLDKVTAYVKDERFNLNILTYVLTFSVSCYALQLACPFVGSCFGHAMSKVGQYTIDDSKICASFSKVSLKEVQWM